MTDKYQKLPVFHFAKEIKQRHNKKNLRCLIMGNFGAHNLGDEALLAGQIQELSTIAHLTLTVVTRNPKEVKRLHKVSAISLFKLNTLRKEIKRSDFIIVGGGGLINKIERNFIGLLYQLYMLLAFFYIPNMYKKKIYVLGIGIYKNANPFIVWLVLPLLKAAQLLTVRDFHSAQFLKNKNVHATLYKDNSYLMPLFSQQDVLKHPYFAKNYQKDRKHIGISLVKPANKEESKKLISILIQFIEKYQKEADFWFYSADYHPKYDHDEKFAKTIVDQLRAKNKDLIAYFVPNSLSPEVFFSSFKLMDQMICMRFHAMLFAYRLNIPFAGVPYDIKCSSLLDSIGKKSLAPKSLSLNPLTNNIL